MAEFNIGKSTLYDIKSSKESILQRSHCHNEQGYEKYDCDETWTEIEKAIEKFIQLNEEND